jgi:3-oxoacyl-[acyl-carrier protein] reductase
MSPLDRKTALVTGGSRGIGRAIVEQLAADGASVMFSFLENQTAAERVVASQRRAGRSVFAVQADQGRREDVERLFQDAARRLDGLDILVINAAAFKRANVIDVAETDYERMLAVNIRGPLVALQLAARQLRDNGRIVHISTMGTARSSSPSWGVYNCTKAAVEKLIVAIATEVGKRGITANSVSPGVTDTDGLHENQHPEALLRFRSATALQRLGQPADIAKVVAFLAGPESQWVTGQNIRATGGLV